MIQHELSGLDAQNPLGFLAALGLLRVLDDVAAAQGTPKPRLAFSASGSPVPILHTDLEFDALVEAVLADAAAQEGNRALKLAYTKEGERVSADDPAAIRDLKPPLHVARELLEECSAGPPRTSQLAAAWFSELVADNKGNTKPTAFHFTAGQQTFLSMVDQLRREITADDVREALRGPWSNTSSLPSLSWDASVSRNYALRASDPSKEKRGSVPAANWLAVIALQFFPVAEQRGKLATTGIIGGWKDSTFYWPLWHVPITAHAATSLLRVDARRWTSSERAAVGIFRVLRAGILRSDQGGYGSFSPADVVLPART